MTLLSERNARPLDFEKDGFPSTAWYQNLDSVYEQTCEQLYFPFFWIGEKEGIKNLAEHLTTQLQKQVEGLKQGVLVAYFEHNDLAFVSLRNFNHKSEEVEQVKNRDMVNAFLNTAPHFEIMAFDGDELEYQPEGMADNYLQMIKRIELYI